MHVPNLICLAFLALVFALVLPTRADDYQCVSDQGCHALMPGPSGTRTVKFKKGDIVSTSSGWIVNPALGWKPVDVLFELRAETVPPDPRTILLSGLI